MANIYEKISGDKTLVLAVREGFMRKFNFGAWTDMAIGMYSTAIVGDNTAFGSDETLTVITNADRGTFGLKNSSNTILPGLSGSYFLGGCSKMDDATTAAFNTSWGNGGGQFPAVALSGSVVVAGGNTPSTMNQMSYPVNGGTGANTYNCYYGLRFTITNRGASNQTIRMRYSRVDNVSGTDYSTTALTTQIANASWNDVSGGNIAHTWNNGSEAYPIPDALWFRIPFYTRNYRISSVAAIKIA